MARVGTAPVAVPVSPVRLPAVLSAVGPAKVEALAKAGPLGPSGISRRLVAPEHFSGGGSQAKVELPEIFSCFHLIPLNST